MQPRSFPSITTASAPCGLGAGVCLQLVLPSSLCCRSPAMLTFLRSNESGQMNGVRLQILGFLACFYL